MKCTHSKLFGFYYLNSLQNTNGIDCIYLPVCLSQIPSSAVEMPGSADISGLNVQFGALDFGSEAAGSAVDMAQMEMTREQAPAQAPAPVAPAPMAASTAVPTQQPQSSLFSKPGSVRCVWEVF